jgi:hypothetical protein
VERTDGQVHVYPPASSTPPCKQGDGQVRLSYTDASGASQTAVAAPQWDAARSFWFVPFGGGRVYLSAIPECSSEVR